ncbi:hypothetical protein Bpfe_025566 [Biomphalaria pfeifferi]|uniref:Uncharacterized protein n=1 Tax=Biomphalaria pfeifferi TaxID=112525 RepID=A0AAD8EZE2_BIOPF|nr:hypothetical protein Bpfe_025566 [Biomphalaria pfeifferi]
MMMFLFADVLAKIEANQLKDFDWISEKEKKEMALAEKKRKAIEAIRLEDERLSMYEVNFIYCNMSTIDIL